MSYRLYSSSHVTLSWSSLAKKKDEFALKGSNQFSSEAMILTVINALLEIA